MAACGAKTQDGSPCQKKAGPNGRCHWHGKRAGRPPIHGRASKYAQVFGEGYRLLVNDPEILRSNAELALFDQFILERAAILADGFSGLWLEEIRGALAALRAALFTTPNAQLAKAAFGRLEELTQRGGERVAAWEELLDKAGQRSGLASKARAAEGNVSESDMVKLFGKMLEIIADVVGGDTADRVARRFEREIIGRVREGPGGEAVGAGEPAVN
jgi:hypothetical protein